MSGVVARLRRLEAAATPGPWEARGWDIFDSRLLTALTPLTNAPGLNDTERCAFAEGTPDHCTSRTRLGFILAIYDPDHGETTADATDTVIPSCLEHTQQALRVWYERFPVEEETE